MRRVAVTGSLASGKTAACRIFEELGAYVVSADTLVHRLLTPATPVGQKVVSLLGPAVLVEGEISREAVAERVFRDLSLLEELEKQLHPEVQRAIEAEYEVVSHQPLPLFCVEVPLLFESGQEKYYDTVIVVYADRESCRSRFIRATRYDGEEFDRRERRLMPIEEKCRHADVVLDNRGSLSQLRHSVKIIFNTLKG